VYHHCKKLVHIISPTLFSSYIQLKTNILNKAILGISPFPSDSTNHSANKASSASDDILAQTTNANEIMLDNFLKSIDDDIANDTYADDDQEENTAKSQCENELYQLLLGYEFKMNMQEIESKVYNCPLSWWKSSAHWYINLGKLAIKYLAIPATSAPSELICSRAARVLNVKQIRMKEDVTDAMMYCKENKHILRKHYKKITKEKMHEGNHHLIERHKALLPAFEDANDDCSESNIDVGVDVD
jgi:hypothetical protein